MEAIGNKQLKTAIVMVYISLWTAFYLLVNATSHGGKFAVANLNPTILTIRVECIKLVISACLFLVQQRRGTKTSDETGDLHQGSIWRLLPSMLRQNIPIASLYALYNNLMIYNLRKIDATTYLIHSSTRLVMGAYMWQWVFRKKMSPRKKTAIGILTAGLLVQGLSEFMSGGVQQSSPEKTQHPSDTFTYLFHAGLVLAQMVCSASASVYNEAVLKSQKKNTHLQNACLCADSILLNLGILMLTRNPYQDESIEGKYPTKLLAAIVFVLACAGLMTSFFLRYLDSISKSVASALETVMTPLLGHVVFGYDVTASSMLSAVLVSMGTFYYTLTDGIQWQLSFVTTTSQSPVCFKHRHRFLLSKLFVLLTSCYCSTNLFARHARRGNVQNDLRGGKKFATPLEWFEEESLLNGMTESNKNLYNNEWLDENLHRLSRWRFSTEEWKVFVHNHFRNEQVQTVLQKPLCRILDIGGGVGAFARTFLKSNESILSYTSIDQSEKAVIISRIANLKDTRFHAFAASMEDYEKLRKTIANVEAPDVVPPASHDIVIMAGCLCYMQDETSVYLALKNALNELNPGGLLILSMLPRTIEAMRSCETMVPPSLLDRISKALRYEIVTMDDMSAWGTGNQRDRYLVVLKNSVLR